MLITEAGEKDLVVDFDKVEAAVTGNECGNLFGVLDQLNTDGLSDGRVGLLGLDSPTRMVSLFPGWYWAHWIIIERQ